MRDNARDGHHSQLSVVQILFIIPVQIIIMVFQYSEPNTRLKVVLLLVFKSGVLSAQRDGTLNITVANMQ